MGENQVKVVVETVKRCEAIMMFFEMGDRPITRRELLELTKEERAELAELCAADLRVELE